MDMHVHARYAPMHVNSNLGETKKEACNGSPASVGDTPRGKCHAESRVSGPAISDRLRIRSLRVWVEHGERAAVGRLSTARS